MEENKMKIGELGNINIGKAVKETGASFAKNLFTIQNAMNVFSIGKSSMEERVRSGNRAAETLMNLGIAPPTTTTLKVLEEMRTFRRVADVSVQKEANGYCFDASTIKKLASKMGYKCSLKKDEYLVPDVRSLQFTLAKTDNEGNFTLSRNFQCATDKGEVYWIQTTRHLDPYMK